MDWSRIELTQAFSNAITGNVKNVTRHDMWPTGINYAIALYSIPHPNIVQSGLGRWNQMIQWTR